MRPDPRNKRGGCDCSGHRIRGFVSIPLVFFRLCIYDFVNSVRIEVTYVTVRIEPSIRFNCGSNRILCGCVLAHHPPAPQPEFPEPYWLCFRHLLCDWSWSLLLGENFGVGSKEATVVSAGAPVRSSTDHYSGMRVVLGWRFHTRCYQHPDIRSIFYAVASVKARVSEGQRRFTLRAGQSRHAVSQIVRIFDEW
jgi:hypothetical protein